MGSTDTKLDMLSGSVEELKGSIEGLKSTVEIIKETIERETIKGRRIWKFPWGKLPVIPNWHW